jgi:hypothetical protein
MSNVQFTNLPAAITVTDADIIAIVQANISKRATIQQIKDSLVTTNGTVTSVTGEGEVNGITLTGEVTESGFLTLGGALSDVSLTSQISGILQVENGGTGTDFLDGIVVGNGIDPFTTTPIPDGGLVGQTENQTLQNKIIEPRVNVLGGISPLVWNSSTCDLWCLTEQSLNLVINADTGSPTNGRKMQFRIKDDGTSRTISWTTGVAKGFREIGVTLPTATVVNKTVYVGCIYNFEDSRWDAVAVAQEA